MDRDAAAQPAILVVDDDPTVAEMLGRMVQRLLPVADVRVAVGGPQALDALVAQLVDLVLTDLRMPDVGGEQLTRTIKARWPTIRVILISASSLEVLEKVAREVQADGYLVKPFTRGELAQMLQQVLRS